MEQQLHQSNEAQISTSDSESRQMITRNNITEVAYNTQTTVDEKHKLPIDYKVTNTNDSKAMGNMLRRAKSILRTNEFTALYDKGYHTGSEFEIANNLDIDVLVAIPTVAANAPNPEYNVEHFAYDIVGKNALRKYLKVLVLSISMIYRPIRFKLNHFKAINFSNKILSSILERFLNRLIFAYYLIRTGAF